MMATIEQILATVAGNPGMGWMGPYNIGDGNTEVIKTCRIVIIPHSVVSLFFARPNGVTPRIPYESKRCTPMKQACSLFWPNIFQSLFEDLNHISHCDDGNDWIGIFKVKVFKRSVLPTRHTRKIHQCLFKYRVDLGAWWRIDNGD